MVSRRTFLKAGLLGGVALGGAGVWFRWQYGAVTPGVLGAREREIVAALVPAVLDGTLPGDESRAEAIETTVDGVGVAIAGLSAAAQAEMADLFALLNFAPTRVLLAGVVSPWPSASPETVAAFLQRWRGSRFALLQSAYAALHDLVLGAWYGRARAWPAIDYPGPPRLTT